MDRLDPTACFRQHPSKAIGVALALDRLAGIVVDELVRPEPSILFTARGSLSMIAFL
jgi:hypothetical protein